MIRTFCWYKFCNNEITERVSLTLPLYPLSRFDRDVQQELLNTEAKWKFERNSYSQRQCVRYFRPTYEIWTNAYMIDLNMLYHVCTIPRKQRNP